jgi:non-specific serine/threonine protein kinase
MALWRQGDLDAAATRLRDALRRLHQVNETHSTIWCVDALAWIAFDQSRPERAATLLGAAERLTQVMGAPAGILPELATHHQQYRQRARDALGEPAYRAAFTRGAQMSLDEAIAHALEQPWRTTPADPLAAATPLTRREAQIAELITQGLTNKEIAAKLVISQRTAESHVGNILIKLGCTSRAQVVTWMAGQHSPTASAEGNAG